MPKVIVSSQYHLKERETDRDYRVAHDRQRVLLERAQWLTPPDRLLIELVLDGRQAMRQIAAFSGVPAGTITRRIRRIVNRLYDPLVVALLDDHCPLPREHRQLGIEHFLQGRTAAQLAELHRMNTYRVHKILEFVRGWHRGRTGAGA
jgi:DNA-directed RNA polymerase specialized sigma24 family protein